MDYEASSYPACTPLTAARPEVLVVDDDPDAHFLLKRQFVKLGIHVPLIAANDGIEAVEMLDRCLSAQLQLPRLILLDIKMPVMTGFDVLRWISARQLLGRITVVMLSSSDDAGDIKRSMSLGAHSYLTKPPSSELLRELITSTIRLGEKRGA